MHLPSISDINPVCKELVVGRVSSRVLIVQFYQIARHQLQLLITGVRIQDEDRILVRSCFINTFLLLGQNYLGIQGVAWFSR